MYVEVSAKTGDNISTIFNNTAQILLGFELTKMEGEESNKPQQDQGKFLEKSRISHE